MKQSITDRRKRNWFWAENEIFDLGLKAGEISVYLFLCRAADSNGKSWYSHERMAQKAGMSVKQLKRTLKLLAQKGLVEIQSQKANGRANLYIVRSPSDNATSEPKMPEKDGGVGQVDLPGRSGRPTQVGQVDLHKDYPIEGLPIEGKYMAENAFPPKNNSKPIPEVKKFIDLFSKTHKKYLNSNYIVNGKQDGELTRRVVKAHNLEKLEKLLPIYFSLRNNFYVERMGYSIPSFYKCLPILLKLEREEA